MFKSPSTLKGLNAFKKGGGVPVSVLVGLIVTLGMLVIVPVGLRLVGAPEPAAIRRAWPLFAVPGAVCLWLPRGAPAAALGFALCAMAAWHRLRRSDPADGAGRAGLAGRTGRPRRSLRAPGTREICET